MAASPGIVQKVSDVLVGVLRAADEQTTAFLVDHPELAAQLKGLGSREDMLIFVMVGLVISFIIFLAALMRIRPSRRPYYESTSAANDRLLFSKYAYTPHINRDSVH